MAHSGKGRKWAAWAGVNLCRLLLAATFAFSGGVKLIDPRGTQYKVEDYALLFGVEHLSHLLAISLAVALAMTELYIGFNLCFGIRRRSTTRLALAFLLVMTPLTLYLALGDRQMDCGCFGDALRLTPWQTAGKNVVLLLATLVCLRGYRWMTRFISERNQWLLSLYSLVFALFFALYNIRYLPIMDFRPYRIGVDLPRAIEAEWLGESQAMDYMDFGIQTPEGEDITQEWLERPGYKFLLLAPRLEQADDSQMDRINALYDYCRQQNYPMLCLTASTQDARERWQDQTGAEYPFALTDGTVLKTMIRANPGLMLLHDGVIYAKWSANNLPDAEQLQAPLEDLRLGQMQQRGRMRVAYRMLLWFLLPLLAWTLIDRVWVGRKLYRHHLVRKHIAER